MNKSIVLWLLLGIAIGATVIYAVNRIPKGTEDSEGNVPSEDEMIFCTQDAMICPDGSAVGRVPPTCQFAPCPQTK